MTSGAGLGRRVLPWLLATLFLGFAVSQLDRYGPTFDAVLGDHAYGDYAWEFLKSGDRELLRDEPDILPFYGQDGNPTWKHTYPRKWVYPLGGTLSAASADLFARRLAWLDPIDAHHLICPLAAALLLVLLFRFVERRMGLGAAFATVVALALFPRFLGHAMNNIKDAPTLLFTFAALFAFNRALEEEKGGWIILASLLTGAGLAQKINVVWPLAFFVLVFFGSRAPRLIRNDRTSLRFGAALLLAPAVIIGAYLACSPFYWVEEGFTRWAEHARYVLCDSVQLEGRDHWSAEPLLNLWLVTPPLYPPLALIGLVTLLRRRAFRPETLALLLLLLTVPILRPCFPNMRYFNVIRHSLEIVPVIAILTGTGAYAVVAWLARRAPSGGRRVALAATGAVLLALPQVVLIARIHPFETTYYNVYAGGLGGAQADRRTDANDYWCQSYREGLRWINANAEEGALLLVPVAPWMVGVGRDVWLREDLSFTEDVQLLDAMIENGLLDPNRDGAAWRAQGMSNIYLMFAPLTLRYNLPPHSEIVRFCEQELEPVHRIQRDGGDILLFYRIEL